jgi:hypothetical protein
MPKLPPQDVEAMLAAERADAFSAMQVSKLSAEPPTP